MATPDDEAARLDALRRYDVLDTPPEAAFDEITALAAELLSAPISLVSLVDDRRQWFKSHHGLGASETPREYAFCAHAIADAQAVFEVADTHADARFADNPLVTGPPHVRFYAGAPLVTPDDRVLGTLNVLDRVPRSLHEHERRVLRVLAHQVMAQLELRRRARELQALARERAEAQAAAEQANRAKSEFLSRMSHELRTPLNAVLGFAQIIEADAEGLPSAQAERVAQIRAAGELLLTLVNELLDLASIEAGRLAVQLQPVALRPLVASCLEVSRPLAQRAGVELRSCVDAALGVRADPVRLKQVLLNLVSNAIKYNRPSGGFVEVSAQAHAGDVRITVLDNGEGLDADQLARLFQPFERLGAERRRNQEGTGLGLAIAHRLAVLMDGELGAASKRGAGSQFTLTLPTA